MLPLSERDNGGHSLGLFEYELILTPPVEWVPIPGFSFLLEGEHDWNQGTARTFNTRVGMGKVLGLYWHSEYRTDQVTDGTITYGASTSRLGRWSVDVNSQYDLELSRTQNYIVTTTRYDHDWRFQIGVIFDQIGDETRFFVRFEPDLGGVFEPRERYYVNGWRGQ